MMNSNIFPLPFYAHLVFCLVSFAVFMFQFVRVRKPYQIIMAAAIPATLLIYLNESRTWFYIVGIAEAVLIAAAIVTLFLGKKNKKNAADEAEASDKA